MDEEGSSDIDGPNTRINSNRIFMNSQARLCCYNEKSAAGPEGELKVLEFAFLSRILVKFLLKLQGH